MNVLLDQELLTILVLVWTRLVWCGENDWQPNP